MRKYLFIALGGFLGAVLRFKIKNISMDCFKSTIPLSTLLINITGSFALAFITTAALKEWNLNKDLKLGICTGFMGAYTTFSTLCKECVLLANAGNYLYAFLYMVLSIFLGLIFAYLGFILGRNLGNNFKDKELA